MSIENPLRGMSRFFAPMDVTAANEAWGANCGPAALAAALRCMVDRTAPLFPDFGRKGYVNAGDMERALRMRSVPFAKTGWGLDPHFGVALIQIHGSWCNPGVPLGAALRRTHWVAVQHNHEGRWIYDVNADRWTTENKWLDGALADVIAATKGASGDWQYRCGFDFPDPIDAVAVEPGPHPRFVWTTAWHPTGTTAAGSAEPGPEPAC